MSLSVNSSLPKALSLLAASTNTSLSEGLPGKFAALLSGELLGLNGPDKNIKLTPEELVGKFASLLPKEGLVTGEAIAEISGKLLNANRLEKDTKLSPKDLSDQNTSMVDPSMLVSLPVTPPLLPEIQLSGKIDLQAGAEKIEKRTSELMSAITADEKGFDRLEQRKSFEGLGAFERLVSSAQRTLESPSTGNETAISAVGGNSGETSNASLASLASANPAIKQSREGLSTGQSDIHTHLRESSWSQQFGEKIVWLAKNDQQSAQININPPELGPVQITLNLSGDQAKVTFASPHMEVRQAIENSLPQLKEMLSSAGINLGQTNVGANLAQQNPENPYHNANGKRLADENAILPANDKALNVTTNSALQKGRGLVDLFA